MKERPILFQRAMVRALLAGTKTQTRRALKVQPGPSCCIEEGMLGEAPFVYSQLHGDGPGHEVRERRSPCRCPYGEPGDRLWVKETFFAFGRWETRFSAEKGRDEWHFVDMTLETGHSYCYAADGGEPALLGTHRSAGVTPAWWKRPAIFMPRAACRVLLEVAGVRVERLQAISEKDAIAEGCITENIVSDYDGSTIQVPAEIPHPSGIGAQGWDTAREWYADLWESINGDGSWDASPWVWVVEFRRIPPQ